MSEHNEIAHDIAEARDLFNQSPTGKIPDEAFVLVLRALKQLNEEVRRLRAEFDSHSHGGGNP